MMNWFSNNVIGGIKSERIILDSGISVKKLQCVQAPTSYPKWAHTVLQSYIYHLRCLSSYKKQGWLYNNLRYIIYYKLHIISKPHVTKENKLYFFKIGKFSLRFPKGKKCILSLGENTNNHNMDICFHKHDEMKITMKWVLLYHKWISLLNSTMITFGIWRSIH